MRGTFHPRTELHQGLCFSSGLCLICYWAGEEEQEHLHGENDDLGVVGDSMEEDDKLEVVDDSQEDCYPEEEAVEVSALCCVWVLLVIFDWSPLGEVTEQDVKESCVDGDPRWLMLMLVVPCPFLGQVLGTGLELKMMVKQFSAYPQSNLSLKRKFSILIA